MDHAVCVYREVDQAVCVFVGGGPATGCDPLLPVERPEEGV